MRYILSCLIAFTLVMSTATEAKRKPPVKKAALIKNKGPINDIGAWPINDIVPLYTELAQYHSLEGEILASVLVDKFGKPKKMRIERSGIGIQDEQVRKALLQARFNPAMKNGEPVECWWTQRFVFKMSEEEKARRRKWREDRH